MSQEKTSLRKGSKTCLAFVMLAPLGEGWDEYFTGEWSLGAKRVVPCQSCQGGFKQECWMGMTEWVCAIWSFWVIGLVKAIAGCLLLLCVRWLEPQNLCPLWVGEVTEEEEGNERHGIRAERKEGLIQEGKYLCFQGGTKTVCLKWDNSSLLRTTRTNAAHRNKPAHLIFIKDLER